MVAVPEQHWISAPVEMPLSGASLAHSGLGVSVTLPEWTASAVGGYSQRSSTQRSPARQMSPISQFE